MADPSRKHSSGESADTPMIEEALKYAANGWKVLPLHSPVGERCSCSDSSCRSVGKHPRTKSGVKDASSDVGTIRGWFTRWPEANLGIATGRLSGLCVIDVDGEDGDSELRALQAAEPLPQTLRILTGRKNKDGKRDGYHLYFKYPFGASVANSSGSLGKGIDVRGDGGYVVAPPSLHASGLSYEWDGGEGAIADLPEWLFLRESSSGQAAIQGVACDIPEGQRNSVLCSLAGTMHHKGMAPTSISAALQEENRQRCKPPLSPKEVDRVVASVVRRYQAGLPLSKTSVILKKMAEVQEKNIHWLWHNYIPRGMLTLLSGAGGTGKSTLAFTFAAIVSNGGMWPDSSTCSGPGNVVIYSTEDDVERTIKPRLLAAGADMNKVFIVEATRNTADSNRPFDLSTDMETLYEPIEAMGGISLFVVDPIVNAVVRDMHKANDVRRGLQPLVDFASRANCAAVGITHFAKNSEGRNPTDRVIGSQAFSALARTVFVTAKDDQSNRYILSRSKSNISADSGAFSYEILPVDLENDLKTTKIQWGEQLDGTSRELLQTIEAPGGGVNTVNKISAAMNFLLKSLSDGPLPVESLFQKAAQESHSLRTLERAKDKLNIETAKGGLRDGWVWSLPKSTARPRSPDL